MRNPLIFAPALVALVLAACEDPPSEQWVAIGAGTFSMGSPPGEHCRRSDEPRRLVSLTADFVILASEVTQAEYSKWMGTAPSYFDSCGSSCPVEMVSWDMAAAHCNALSLAEGRTPCYQCTGKDSAVDCAAAATFVGRKIYTCKGYRLPTEAEWERAYRGETTSALYNGPITTCDGGDPTAESIGWYSASSGDTPHKARHLKPNALGLFDMAGNVAEWCHDAYKNTVSLAAASDPVTTASGLPRVTRGGSWADGPGSLRGASRAGYGGAPPAAARSSKIGFRCVRTTGSPRLDAGGAYDAGPDGVVADAGPDAPPVDGPLDAAVEKITPDSNAGADAS